MAKAPFYRNLGFSTGNIILDMMLPSIIVIVILYLIFRKKYIGMAKRIKIGKKFFTYLDWLSNKREVEKRKRYWRKKGYKYFRVKSGSYMQSKTHWQSKNTFITRYQLYGRKTK